MHSKCYCLQSVPLWTGSDRDKETKLLLTLRGAYAGSQEVLPYSFSITHNLRKKASADSTFSCSGHNHELSSFIARLTVLPANLSALAVVGRMHANVAQHHFYCGFEDACRVCIIAGCLLLILDATVDYQT